MHEEETMEGKGVAESTTILSYALQPQDANPAGNVHGGVIMKHIDTAAGVVAARHARCNVVTASIDRLDFHNPAFIGNLLILKASANIVGRTSMEIGVRAEAEDIISGSIRHIASAYLTFVALDENGRPKQVPPLICETQEEIGRECEARSRRDARLAQKTREKECLPRQD
jgi:acyl-CoA hydrolase